MSAEEVLFLHRIVRCAGRVWGVEDRFESLLQRGGQHEARFPGRTGRRGGPCRCDGRSTAAGGSRSSVVAGATCRRRPRSRRPRDATARGTPPPSSHTPTPARRACNATNRGLAAANIAAQRGDERIQVLTRQLARRHPLSERRSRPGRTRPTRRRLPGTRRPVRRRRVVRIRVHRRITLGELLQPGLTRDLETGEPVPTRQSRHATRPARPHATTPVTSTAARRATTPTASTAHPLSHARRRRSARSHTRLEEPDERVR